MSRKGYKSIGTQRDVEKRGATGTLARCREKRGVSLQFGKIYLPKGVFFSKIYRYFFANDQFYLV